MGYYKDLRRYLDTLEHNGKLTRIKSPINKDTELMPLVRLQFRGLPEQQRKGFLFENIVNSKGIKYNATVAVAVLAGSSEIYAIGFMCDGPQSIAEKWAQAQLHPIKPRMVDDGPVYQEVHLGSNLLVHGGLEEFPIPISTPGYDVAPYITAACCVTKDPESGIRNVGTYRAQIKSQTRTGIFFGGPSQGGWIHWQKCKKRGTPLEVAIVIGGPPSIGYVSVSPLPIDTDEFTVAGGIAGEPVELVKCKTVDLEVPAQAEIVIEGELSTKELEPEAPFGEALGLMGLPAMAPYLTVKCISHRKNPIWLAFISQYPPSESSKIKRHSRESVIYKQLKYDLGMSHVLAVACHESGGIRLWVIQVKKTEAPEVWRTLEAVGNLVQFSKIIVAVDEDVDPWDAEAVNWAMSTRIQPHRDCRIVKSRAVDTLDYSLMPAEELEKQRHTDYSDMPENSRLLIDTTMKWPYPPISLPKKVFMENALRIWHREGLPQLTLKQPWWGYDLGLWTPEYEADAALAINDEYYRTGERQAQKREPA